MTSPVQYKLPDNLDQEINDLEEMIVKFKSGESNLTEFKVFRVPFGCYEQRAKDTYMVRIRCAGACITPEQLERVVELSQKYGTDHIHLTSREEIQLHYVDIDSIVPVLRKLKEVGLGSRGGGGNTVRNIMAQEDSGISDDEVFDVTPYAIALTSRMLEEADSWNLPRKFKIAFSCSEDDRGYATISDVGFIASMKGDKEGFKVYAAGGLGARPAEGNLLLDFIEESEVYNVTKALKNLFFKNGNRRNKHAARLRFVWKTLGEEGFKAKYREEYEAVKKENYPALETQKINNIAIDPNITVEEVKEKADFNLWKERFVVKQRQEGVFSVIIPAHLGHLPNESALALAKFLKPFGENTIRVRKDQNFLVRNISEKYLPNLYVLLKNMLPNANRPFILDKILCCAGASTCQLGICLSPNATIAIRKYLEKSDLNLDVVADAKINISGCPNSCGQHHIADVGFFGKVSRHADHVYPSYNVVVGGVVKEGKTKLAEKVGEVPAKRIPQFMHDVFEVYSSKKGDFASFSEYAQTKGKEDLKAICEKYASIPDFDEDKNFYFDWGSDNLFSLAERGKGECSAGVFDLIEGDFKNIEKAKEEFIAAFDGETKKQRLKDIVLYSSRVLLVSRAVEPKTEGDVFKYFREHFIQGGLVDASFDVLIQLAEAGNNAVLLEKETQVYALSDRMKVLYDVMDNGFEFKLPEGQVSAKLIEEEEKSVSPSQVKPSVVKDFRGVACPMNFVKTKMELSKLKSRDVLEVLLDDGAPIENVPGSVREEGHKILGQKKIDDHWSVLIEKM